MDTAVVIDRLNRVMALELTAAIQYQQQAFLVHGPHRIEFAEYFEEAADEARKHARLIGRKIVALGGLPTVEPAPIRQSADLEGMLRQSLDLERANLAAVLEAHGAAEGNVALRILLEDLAREEQDSIDELERYLSLKPIAATPPEIRLRRAQ
jgi:bacterioferritin